MGRFCIAGSNQLLLIMADDTCYGNKVNNYSAESSLWSSLAMLQSAGRMAFYPNHSHSAQNPALYLAINPNDNTSKTGSCPPHSKPKNIVIPEKVLNVFFARLVCLG